MTLFNRFLKDESGATAIEYALIAALVAVAIIGALELLGTGITDTFNTVKDKLNEAGGGGGGGDAGEPG